jgi:integrase
MTDDNAKTVAELRAELARLRDLLPKALSGRLSATKIAQLKKRGAYSDGGNLYVQVNKEGKDGRSWIFRWKDRVTGKYRNIGLGSYRTINIDKARQLAQYYRMKLLEGKNPRDVRNAEKLDIRIARKLVKTGSEVVNEWFAEKISRRAPRYANKVANQLNKWVHPLIGDMPIEKVETVIILDTKIKISESSSNRHKVKSGDEISLSELWKVAYPTTRDVLQYLDRIFQFAIAKKYYTGSRNPAEWKKLVALLPPHDTVHRRERRKDLPYQDVGRFLQAVRNYEDRSDRKTGRTNISYVLEIITLTGVRISEVLEAQWKEFDLGSMTWNVPAGHKKNKGHNRPVPITKSILAVLGEMQRRYPNPSPDDLVFPSERTSRPIKTSSPSNFVTNTLKWEIQITPHGFRSTLRNWMRAKTNFRDVLWKAQVDHQLGDGTQTDEAYGGDLLLEERRPMMKLWDDYCCTKPQPKPQTGKVVNLPKRRTA